MQITLYYFVCPWGKSSNIKKLRTESFSQSEKHKIILSHIFLHNYYLYSKQHNNYIFVMCGEQRIEMITGVLPGKPSHP